MQRQLQPHWAIVLAGGEGRRCRSVTESRYSDGRPKQFCALAGEETLVEQTLRRARRIVAPYHTVLTVGERHLRWRAQWEGRGPLLVCVEPEGADTGPAALLGALIIRRHAPNAIVTIFPSDHYVGSDEVFGQLVLRSVERVQRNPADVVLLGAEASTAETEYGWLLPLEGGRSEALPRCRLIEKPSAATAQWLLRMGAYWNTLVMTCSVERLQELALQAVPRAFGILERGMRTGDLRNAYASLRPFNLSSDILQPSPLHVRVLPMRGLEWVDLGSSARLRALGE